MNLVPVKTIKNNTSYAHLHIEFLGYDLVKLLI